MLDAFDHTVCIQVHPSFSVSQELGSRFQDMSRDYEVPKSLTGALLTVIQWTMLVSFYLASRFFMATYLLFLAAVVPMVRPVMICQATLAILPGAIWIASIHVDMPNRLALIWIAIFADLTAPMLVVILVRRGQSISTRLGAWVARTFEFYPAMNIEHRTERTNAFVGLVFGYSVVAIIYQNAAHFGLNAFFGKAALGLVQAFCFNWIYFELDGADLYQHAIRRNVISCMFKSYVLIYVLTFFSNYMGYSASPIHHEFRPRRRLTLQTRRRHRLPQCRPRRPDRVLPREVRARGPRRTTVVLLRRSGHRAGHDGYVLFLLFQPTSLTFKASSPSPMSTKTLTGSAYRNATGYSIAS